MRDYQVQTFFDILVRQCLLFYNVTNLYDGVSTLNIVEIKNMSMQYRLQKERITSLKEYLVKFVQRKLQSNKFWVLNDINLNILKNESLALFGHNGAGKSTLLKLIAGVVQPTKGKVLTKGSIAPLINLGAGFDMELTAHDNIYISCAVLGFSKKEIQKKYDSIVEFAEVRQFLDVPLKNFSSGMVAKLGFAVASDSPADIFIVDEVLSVGDTRFQQKCRDRVQEIRKTGTTFIFVTHDLDTASNMCHKGLWLNSGRIVEYGDIDLVCQSYSQSQVDS